MSRTRYTRYIIHTLIAAALVGFAGDIMFRASTGSGILQSIMVLLLIAAVIGVARLNRVPINRRNLWILAPIIGFAVLLAVRAENTIWAINSLAVLFLGALGLIYLYSANVIDEDATGDHVGAALEGAIMTGFAPFGIGFQALEIGWDTLKHGKLPKQTGAVVRGLLIAAPIVLVFLVLFASADAVFAGAINRVFDLFDGRIFNELWVHVVTIGVIGWVTAGAITAGVGKALSARSAAPAAESNNAEAKPKRQPFLLGTIESMIVLGSVTALFGVFVIVQFTYFFGGESTLELTNLTHAQYARRGFFELIAVSLLTLGLVLWLDWVTVRRSARERVTFRLVASGLIALTGVILLSAAHRMFLYEQEYGYTHLRLFVHVFIYWMGGVFIAFLLTLYRVRGEKRIFSVGVLICLIGYLLTMNLLNVDYQIAARNIERHQNGQGVALDTAYLYSLSSDALEPMLAFYQSLPPVEPEAMGDVQYAVGQWLARQLYRLRSEVGTSPGQLLSFNLSKWTAYARLTAVADTLPAYDQNFYLSSYYMD